MADDGRVMNGVVTAAVGDCVHVVSGGDSDHVPLMHQVYIYMSFYSQLDVLRWCVAQLPNLLQSFDKSPAHPLN